MIEYPAMIEILEVELTDGPHEGASAQQLGSAEQREALPDHDGSLLWSMTLTLGIQGPGSWWRQASSYFPEVLWLRARPEEPDHLRRLRQDDFEQAVPEKFLEHLNELARQQQRAALAAQLPGSFLRKGMVQTNLETLADILHERGHYRHGHWFLFCEAIRGMTPLARYLQAPEEAAT